MPFKRRARIGRAHGEAPVELRFVDLFLVLVAALIFLVVTLSLLNVSRVSTDTPPLEILTMRPPHALQDTQYSLYLAPRGGQPPYRWRVVDGALPSGLDIDEGTGLIHGVTGFSGSRRFTVGLRDGLGGHARRQLELTVVSESQADDLHLDFHSALLPLAVATRQYDYHIHAIGGTFPYTYSIVQGKLPNGLLLSPDGDLTGSANFLGRDPQLLDGWHALMQVRDSRGLTIEHEITIPGKYEFPSLLPAPDSSGFLGLLEGWFLALCKFVFLLIGICLAISVFLSFLLGIGVLACGVAGFRGADADGHRGLFGIKANWADSR